MGFRVHLKLGHLLFSESKVKECCSLWLIGSAGLCLLVRLLVRLNLVSLSFPTSDPPSFVKSFIIVSIRFCESKYGGVICSCVDSV